MENNINKIMEKLATFGYSLSGLYKAGLYGNVENLRSNFLTYLENVLNGENVKVIKALPFNKMKAFNINLEQFRIDYLQKREFLKD